MTAVPIPTPVAGLLARLREHPQRLTRAKLAVVLGAVVLAYHYSLLTLVRSLQLETPLAYLGLVPFMALGLAALRAKPADGEPDIHDRQIDYIVGVPLLGAAIAVITIMPARMSTLFWVWRIDLLSLPLFVAGACAIVFGVRTMWRVRLGIGFLLLAWPLPYTLFLTRWLDGFTGLTISALKKALVHVHVAVPTPGSDGSLFAITHGSERFVVSVASACSGVNGMVGFLLVGVAFTALVKGGRLPKVLWLLSGLLLIWALNVARLLLLFWVGQTWGERVAIDGLHPVIGLILFCIGIVVMLWTMPLFRLSLAPAAKAVDPAAVGVHDVEVAHGVEAAHPTAQPSPSRTGGERFRLALGLVTAVAVFMGVANAGMRDYELVAGDLGAARLQSFADAPAVVPGFQVTPTASYPWAQRFFGKTSTWQRYTYSPASVTNFTVGASPVIADVITTDQLSRFSAYGIEACYAFHGYEIRDTSSYDLGGGVTGNTITYYNPKQKLEWNAAYWIWPVKKGGKTVYERVVMLMPSTADVQTLASGGQAKTDLVRGIGLNIYSASKALGGSGSDEDKDAKASSARRYLVDFSRQLVRSRSAAPRGTAPAVR